MTVNNAPTQKMQSDQESSWLPWLGLGLVVFYAAALKQFPYPFLASEAAPMVWAETLLTHGFRFQNSVLFPAYFQFQMPMDAGSLIYVLMVPLISFGKQIWVVRGVSIAASLLTSWWLYQIAKKYLGLKQAILLFFVMISVPGWVYLTRLGTTDILRAAAYTAFIYYYLTYRYADPKAILKCLLAAVVLFYADFNGQVLMLVNGLVFLVIDFRYHWQRKKTFLISLATVSAALVPWVGFVVHNPQVYTQRLALMQPVWQPAENALETVWKIGVGFLNGLNPLNWITVQASSAPAFPLGPFPAVPLWYVFLLPLGLFLAVTMIRKPTGWLWVMVFSPVVFTLLHPFTPAAMAAALPAYFLLIGIVFNALFLLLSKKFPRALHWLYPFTMVVMAAYGIYFLQQALAHQSEWINPYAIRVIRTDSQEIFDFIKRYETAHPEKKYVLNSSWSERPEILHQFFAGDLDGVEFNGLNPYIDSVRDDLGDTLFMLDEAGLTQLRDSGKFTEPFIVNTIRLADGSPLYYFAELSYKPEIKSMIQAEMDARRAPRQDTVEWLGQTVEVHHPALEGGAIANLVDGDTDTLIKTDRVNPLNLVFDFALPVSASEIQFRVGAEAVDLFVTLYPSATLEAVSYSRQGGSSEGNKTISIPFDSTLTFERLEVVVQNKSASESAPIHVWEMTFKP